MLRNPKLLIFVGMIVLQLAMVAAMPLRAMRIRSEGQLISLQLAPVDPYDWLTGYALDLNYRAAQPRFIPKKAFQPKLGQTVFVLLKRDRLVYTPVSMTERMPSDVGPGEVVMRGVYEHRGWAPQIWFGAEKLYIPESERQELSRAVEELQENARKAAPAEQGDAVIPPELIRAELMVDWQGDASLLDVRLRDKVYK